MPDLITGVLVLQRMPHLGAGVFGCWFQYERSDGIYGFSWIPMIEQGTSEPPGHKGPSGDFDARALGCIVRLR